MVSVWPYLMESALACLESMVSTDFFNCYKCILSSVFKGAGKTTTFGILTGDLTLTSGTAVIGGYDIRTNLRDVSACMPVCACESHIQSHQECITCIPYL